MDKLEKDELNSVIDSGWFTESIKTRKFEEMFAKFTKSKYACAVTSGTAGLYLALLALDIKNNDEVIVPDLTFVASPNSIIATGGKVVLCDIEKQTLNVDIEKLERKITKKTKAIMTVNFNGRTGNFKILKEIAKKNNLSLIEDAAHSLGSYYGEKHQGTLSDIGVFSFSTPKIITTGQGGMIVTNNKKLFEKCVKLKDFGREINKKKKMFHTFEHNTIGYNFKFTEFQAAVGISQMRKLQKRMKIKKKMFSLYAEMLKNVDGIEFIETDLSKITPWMMDILIKNKDKKFKLINFLNKQLIETRIFYPPIHSLPPYNKSSKGFAVTKDISDRGLWLPSSVNLVEKDIIRISTLIKKFFSLS